MNEPQTKPEPNFKHAAEIGERIVTLSRTEGRTMNNEESEVLLRMLMTPKTSDLTELLNAAPVFRMIRGCVEAAGLKDKVDQRSLVWLAILANGIPGNVSLLCTVLAFVVKQAGSVTLEYLAEQIFPMRVPSTQVYDTVWSEQKYLGANLVDSLSHE